MLDQHANAYSVLYSVLYSVVILRGFQGHFWVKVLYFNMWYPHASSFQNVIIDLSIVNGSHFMDKNVKVGVLKI